MNDLEMCKAFAELEGIEVYEHACGNLLTPTDRCLFDMFADGKPCDWYKPITDLALNCAARDKYRVSIAHYDEFDCGIDGNGSFDIPCCNVSIKDSFAMLMNVNPADIPRAAIKCILKSEGKWK